jgi:diguanylate cyclase (GGDEF)-like protein
MQLHAQTLADDGPLRLRPATRESRLPEVLRRQALGDGIGRTRVGAALHLPLWVLTGWVTGLVQAHSLLFWLNVAFFALALPVRMVLAYRITERPPGSLGIATPSRIFVALYVGTGAHWGLLAALATACAALEPARIPLWLIVTGICAAGTTKLSMFQAIRVGYPLATMVPTMLVLLAAPTRMNVFALGAATLFLLYVFDSSRVLREDYWGAALARCQLEERALELQQLSSTDALTQLSNRRCFDARLQSEWAQALRAGRALSVMMIDIDHFKRVNDTYGHATGDRCLIAVAGALQSGLKRPRDLLARYGGEEFAVLLPGTALEGAMVVAEHLRQCVAGIAFRDGETSIPLSCSIGVCGTRPTSHQFADTALKGADQALYQAKRSGRNRVVAFREMSP